MRAILILFCIGLLVVVESAEATAEFLFEFGSGSGSGQFVFPEGVETDNNNRIIVADTENNRIQVFNNAGAFLFEFGSIGSGPGQFISPEGVDTDSNDRIIVADTFNSRMQVFDNTGAFLFEFGGFGSGPGQMIEPEEIAIDSNDRIIVAEEGNHRIQVFDSTGSFLFDFGSFGFGPGQFADPDGVAVDSNDRIIVADEDSHRIQVFDNAGIFQFEFGSFGSATRQFNSPGAVAIDSNDRIIVADGDNHRIQIFDSAGTFIFEFGGNGTGPGQFDFPQAVAIDSINNIIVTDTDNSRIQVFDITGTFLLEFGSSPSGPGQFAGPAGLATDGSGRIIVADLSSNRIQVFDSAGIFQFEFGSKGSGPGQFDIPVGVAIDSNDRIIVGDEDNNRIQVFNNAGIFQFEFGTFGSAPGQFQFPIGVAIDSNDRIIVGDEDNNRIQVFNNAGIFQFEFGTFGSAPGQFQFPIGVAIDSNDRIIVADEDNNRIQVFNNAGIFQFEFGTFGSAPGQFQFPVGVAIDSNDRIIVGDEDNNRIQVFNNAGIFQFEFGGSGSGPGQFQFPFGVTVDGMDRIIIGDFGNHRIQVFKDVPAQGGLDLTTSVSTSFSRAQFSRRTGELRRDVVITNNSPDPILAPVSLVIDSISDPAVTLKNADGQTQDQKPFVDLSGHIGDDFVLSPGESSSPFTLIFDNPTRRRFTFETSFFGNINQAVSSNAFGDSAVTFQNTPIDISPLDNDFISAGILSIFSFDSISEQGGTVSDNGGGTLLYTPPVSTGGFVDSFVYVVSDGQGGFDSATIQITIVPNDIAGFDNNIVDITSLGPVPTSLSVDFGDTVTFRNTDTVDHFMDFTGLGGFAETLLPGEFRVFGPFNQFTSFNSDQVLNYSDFTGAPINGIINVALPTDRIFVDITSSGLLPSTIPIILGENVTFRNTDTVDHFMDFTGLGGFAETLLPGEFRVFGPFNQAIDHSYSDFTGAPINGTVSVSFLPAGPHDVDITSSGLSPSTIPIILGENVTFRNTDTVDHFMDFTGLGGFAETLLPGEFRVFGPFNQAIDHSYSDFTGAPINGTVSVSFEQAGPNDVDITSSGLSPSSLSVDFGESVTFRNTDTVDHFMDFTGLGGFAETLLPGEFRVFGPFNQFTSFNSDQVLNYSDFTGAPINGIINVALPTDRIFVDITSSGLLPSTIPIILGENVTFRNTDTVDHFMDFTGLGGFAETLLPGEFRVFGPFNQAIDHSYSDFTGAPINGTVSVSFLPAGPHDVDITSSGLSPSTIPIILGENVTFRNTDTVDHFMDFTGLGGFAETLLPGEFRVFGPFNQAIDHSYSDFTGAPINGTVLIQFTPAANNDIATTTGNTIVIPVLDNDQNPLGGILSVLQTTVPTNGGIVVINPDNTIRYTPTVLGIDTFAYIASVNPFDVGLVTVNVTGLPAN